MQKEKEKHAHLLLAMHILATSSVQSHSAGKTRNTWSDLLMLSTQRKQNSVTAYVKFKEPEMEDCFAFNL